MTQHQIVSKESVHASGFGRGNDQMIEGLAIDHADMSKFGAIDRPEHNHVLRSIIDLFERSEDFLTRKIQQHQSTQGWCPHSCLPCLPTLV